MNVLIITLGDWSGAGFALYKAVNQHTPHTARHVAHEESYLQYPYDVLKPSRAELAELIEWADVVNIHDANDFLIPEFAPRRPEVVTYHGSQYRARWPYYNHLDRSAQRLSTALNLDLAMLGPTWLPRPMDDMQNRRYLFSNGTLRVAHAPTNRQIKDTEAVLKLCGDIPGVELVLIEGVPNDECIRIKSRCHLLIEEFQLGYGTNALENWAMGIPVVAHAHPQILGYMRHHLGTLPFVDTPLTHLRDRVMELRDNRELLDQAAEIGRAYWQQHHRPDKVAGRFIEICEEAINGWSDE